MEDTFICGIVFINLQCLFFHIVLPQCVSLLIALKIKSRCESRTATLQCNIAFSQYLFLVTLTHEQQQEKTRAHMHPNAYCTHVHITFVSKKCEQSKVTYWNDLRPMIHLGVPKSRKATNDMSTLIAYDICTSPRALAHHSSLSRTLIFHLILDSP